MTIKHINIAREHQRATPDISYSFSFYVGDVERMESYRITTGKERINAWKIVRINRNRNEGGSGGGKRFKVKVIDALERVIRLMQECKESKEEVVVVAMQNSTQVDPESAVKALHADLVWREIRPRHRRRAKEVSPLPEARSGTSTPTQQTPSSTHAPTPINKIDEIDEFEKVRRDNIIAAVLEHAVRTTEKEKEKEKDDAEGSLKALAKLGEESREDGGSRDEEE